LESFGICVLGAIRQTIQERGEIVDISARCRRFYIPGLALLLPLLTNCAVAASSQNNCTLTAATPSEGCLVTGAFTIPFKFELSGNKDVFGSASLNGFVGYNTGRVTWLGFFGYSANLSTQSTTTTSSASTGVVSYGLGVAFPIGATVKPVDAGESASRVHVGAVIGFDHIGASQNYAYNNHPWLSVLIGTSF